jgi:hypothetical protein
MDPTLTLPLSLITGEATLRNATIPSSGDRTDNLATQRRFMTIRRFALMQPDSTIAPQGRSGICPERRSPQHQEQSAFGPCSF